MKKITLFRGALTATLALLVCTSNGATGTPPETPRPNIIIILADDYGYGDVGCYGSKRFRTPNIDALAAGGIRFTDFHSNGSVCSPTRAALLTGRYQQRSGINGVITAAGHRHTGLNSKETTFAEIAQQTGYTTALFGKWHLGYKPEYNPTRQGFKEFIGYVSGNIDYHNHRDQTGREDWWKQDQLVPEKGYSTDLITNHAVNFINRNKDTPFILYIAHEAPHYPYQGRLDPPQYNEKGRGKPSATFKTYKEMIEVMDENVGRVVKALAKADISKQTLIFFLSDNGPASLGSAGPLRGKKGQIWEGGHRVPAIAYWPSKIEAGKVSNITAMGADLLPTITAITGAPSPKNLKFDGINLLPHLIENKQLKPRPLFWGMKNRLAIRLGDYKLITNTSFVKPALYNLKEDLAETRNIADQKPEIVQDLLKQLKAWHTDVNKSANNVSN